MSETQTANANIANLIVALLTPMFLWSTAGDIPLAHAAAAQTINAYGVKHRLSLITVAKIIAFDIATLSSLSQSMYEEVSISLALRLRGNANSLDRSAERARHQLEQESRTGAADKTEDSIDAAVAEAQRMVQQAKARIHANAQAANTQAAETSPKAEPAPPPAARPSASAARTSEQQRKSAWAGAMTVVAEEFTAGLKDLPPEERWKEMERIEALTNTAADLASGAAPPPVPVMAAE
jgi:hypothetical protein